MTTPHTPGIAMYRPDPIVGPDTAHNSLGVSASVLAIPTLVVLTGAIRFESAILAAGALATALAGLLILIGFRTAIRPPASASTILLYITALAWLWFPTRDLTDEFVRMGRGTLVLGAILLLVRHDLIRSGVGPRRRVRQLCRWLTRRSKWPEDLADYQHLPEIQALRDTIGDDPSAVLGLLSDPRPEVRVAVLLALQHRSYWRSHEANQVLAAARQAREPAVCAAALIALNSAEDAATIQDVAVYLRNPSPEVRRAAFDVLLHNNGRRWPGVRTAVKEALSDPAFANDGPLPAAKLSALAVCDLNTWAAEAAPLGDRSVQSVVEYYAATLAAGSQPQLAAQIGEQTIDANVPPTMRVELANLLRSFRLLSHELLDRMSDVDQPGPVRLVAAEALLDADPNDPTATEVLRGLGRQPNRETAVTIAWLLQKYLGMDMGLPPDERVSASGKAAAEIANRVLQWASSNRGSETPRHGVPAAFGLPRPQSSPTMSGLKATSIRPGPSDRGPSGSLWSPK